MHSGGGGKKFWQLAQNLKQFPHSILIAATVRSIR
jgi:hypothetical protein